MPFYYRNADADDVYFIHRGEGRIETDFGPVAFEAGDYVVIPRGITYRVVPATTDNFFLLIESYSEIVRFLGDRDITSRRLMEEILAVEEEHADDLKNLLATLDPTKVGA